jgi:hypothetical protein
MGAVRTGSAVATRRVFPVVETAYGIEGEVEESEPTSKLLERLVMQYLSA